MAHLKGKVRVLLFLSHLKAGQMGVFKLQTVFLFEILSYSTFHGLSIF